MIAWCVWRVQFSGGPANDGKRGVNIDCIVIYQLKLKCQLIQSYTL